MFDRGIKSILMNVNSYPKKNSRSFIFFVILGGGIVFFLANFILLFVLIVHLNVFDIFLHFSPKSSISGFNILAFGIDDTAHSKRSDAIIVVHLNKNQNHIGALSIPRDTRVTIPGIGRTRINHAFSHGGIDLLKDSVSQFLGVPINYYVKIDLSGVETLVNALGGLEVNVEKALNYVDYAGDLYIDIPKGKQVLKGKKVMEYLRFRHDEEGDIGRIRRQQLFLDQLVKKILSFDGVLKLPEIIKTAKSIIATDLSFVQLLSLTRDFKDAVKQDSISKATVPGSASLVGGAYYWKPNVTALDKVIEDDLYGLAMVSKQLSQKESAASMDQVIVSKKVPQSVKKIKTIETSVQIANQNTQDKQAKKARLEDASSTMFDDKEVVSKDEKEIQPVMTTESLDDLALEPTETKVLYSEDLSETFDTFVAENETKMSKELADNNLNSISQKQSSSDEKDTIVKNDVTQTMSNNDSVAVSSNNDIIVTSPNRRTLFAKEVQRVAATGILHDVPKFDNLKCEVLNGIGTPGIAKFAAKVFKSLGMIVPRFANAGHFDYAKTMIVDWRGSVDLSLELAHLLEIDPANIVVYNLPNKPLDFTVVLGKDWLEKKNLLDYIYETYKTPDSF